jgi:hypothetical protein
MKEIMVAVVNSSKSKVELFKFINEEEAKNYIKQRYTSEIRNAPIYDYEHTFIDKSFRNAKVSAGVYSVNIIMCKNVKSYNNKIKRKNNCYRKRKTGRNVM